jgi:ATP:cob(I)alamin adenosyltransferase
MLLTRHIRASFTHTKRMSTASALAASVLGSEGVESPAPTRYKVYTKTGDKGTSSLFNGLRKPKDDDFFAALGDVDELNACVGLSREHCLASGVGIEGQLVEIQCRLLDVGSAIATPKLSSSQAQLERVKFNDAITASLETWIDAMDEELPPLKNFILPVRLISFSASFSLGCLALCILYVLFPRNTNFLTPPLLLLPRVC